MRDDRGIELRGVTVRFGGTAALDRVDIEAPKGAIYVLLGKNGAGKTTVVRTIAGLGLPTSGDVRIGGVSVRSPAIHRVRRSLGFLPQSPVLYDDLTGAEFLTFLSDLYEVGPVGQDRTRAGVTRLEMDGRMEDPIRTYSAGMRKKVALLASLLPSPAFWVLDEPYAALDRAGVQMLEEEMERLRKAGAVVFLTSHDSRLAERIADRVGVLDHGRRVFEGTSAALSGTEGQ